MKPRAIGLGLLLVGIGVGVACIPHPKEDFEDFLARTEDARAPLPKEDSGPIDSSAPTEVIEGLYFGSCLSGLSLGDLAKVLRFYSEVKFTPDPSGGKLNIKFSPMKGVDLSSGNPVPTPPSGMNKDQLFGAPFGAENAPVSPAGRFKVVFPEVTLDPNTNPISGRPIKIQNVTFEGVFSASPSAPVDAGPTPTPDAGAGDDGGDGGDSGVVPTPVDASTPVTPGGRPRFCATLGGFVVEPIRQPLDSSTDFCVFVPVKPGDPIPEIKREEYKCALP